MINRLLMLGAPATGKSAVVQCLASARPIAPRYSNLDEEVLAICETRGLEGPLPDAIVDEAVAALLSSNHDGPWICELPHHDYVSLIAGGSLRLEDFDCVAILTASYETLRSRNAHRKFQVPEVYIARCVGSTAALIAWLTQHGAVPWLVCDSELLRPDQSASLISDLLRRTESASLASLAVVPVPNRPYLGGHFLNDSEWDDSLVAQLVLRYQVSTALDVGCGIGLSVERFRAMGVMAWGIDGNPRILEGPCSARERLLIADFTRQWVEWPVKSDLVWCVEVLEHVPEMFERNVLQTIARNVAKVAFVSAAPPGQRGYCHVNCKPRDYWISRFEEFGLRYVPDTPAVLSTLTDVGQFGLNFLKRNGMIFEAHL